jgi:regulator of protease activity HflC (stomatin/prohibitin superfamily)
MHADAQRTAMARVVLLAFMAVGACVGCGGAVIEPGHRALLFNPKQGVPHHEALAPGSYRLPLSARLHDYDVTYSTRQEILTTTTSEGLSVDVGLAVIYRPIVSELYELDTEIGPHYYDEIVGPEFRSAARGVFARHSYVDLTRRGENLEDEVEADVRQRIKGKHVELASVTLESVKLPPDVVAAVRAREVAVETARKEQVDRERAKVEAEEKWQKEKLELEHEVERRRLQREAEGTEK